MQLIASDARLTPDRCLGRIEHRPSRLLHQSVNQEMHIFDPSSNAVDSGFRKWEERVFNLGHFLNFDMLSKLQNAAEREQKYHLEVGDCTCERMMQTRYRHWYCQRLSGIEQATIYGADLFACKGRFSRAV